MILLDQEPEASLGGQAFWSLGGLFLVDSPEQRRVRIHDSPELAFRTGSGSAGFDRPEDAWPRTWARRTSSSPPARSAVAPRPGHALRSRRRAGPSAAAISPPGTATPCRASTSPGVPGPAWSSRSSAACARRRPGPRRPCKFRHRVDWLIVQRRCARRRRRHRARAELASRAAQPSSRTPVGEFELGAEAVIVTSGGIGANHELVRSPLADDAGPPPQRDAVGRARLRRRPDAADHRRRRRDGSSIPTGCGTTPRGSRTGTRSGPATGSASSPARRRSGSTHRPAPARAAVPRLRHARHARSI